MYYKIIKNGYVIDVCDSYGKYSRRGQIIPCNYEEAQFMLGRLPNREVYRVSWLMPLLNQYPEGEIFECKNITQQEYIQLLEEFGQQDTIIHEDSEVIYEEPVESQDEQPVEQEAKQITYSELVNSVRELTASCQKLLEQNRLLEDCILEMSKIIYE